MPAGRAGKVGDGADEHGRGVQLGYVGVAELVRVREIVNIRRWMRETAISGGGCQTRCEERAWTSVSDRGLCGNQERCESPESFAAFVPPPGGPAVLEPLHPLYSPLPLRLSFCSHTVPFRRSQQKNVLLHEEEA